MKLLRSLHLYLGCIFAPMLVFMTVSGIWQTFGLQRASPGKPDSTLAYLSTIHTSWALKSGSWSSPAMKGLILLTAMSFLLTVILGITMAFRFGHAKIVLITLLLGIIVPLGIVLLSVNR